MMVVEREEEAALNGRVKLILINDTLHVIDIGVYSIKATSSNSSLRPPSLTD